MDNREALRAALCAASLFYRTEGRMLPWRRDREPYHIFLSEIMLQQTRASAVIPYYERFLSVYPTVEALANADEGTLFKMWEGLGYYSRARNLKRAAKQVVDAYGGVFPKEYDALLTLAGVGKYTAGAIASISFGVPKSAVDGNAVRIYARLFADGTNASDEHFKARIADALDEVYPQGDDACYTTQGMMEIGQRFCLPNGAPKCDACPLRDLCAVGRGEADFHLYPHKEKKKARRILEKTVLLLTDGEGFYIRRRPDEGLLAGLWEFPALEGHLTNEEAIKAASSLGFLPQGAIEAVAGKHIFTHLEWHMQSFLVPVKRSYADGFTLASPDELRDVYAIPSAFRTFLDYIKSNKG